MDLQVRNDLLLDSIARKESQHQELERMVLDREQMIKELQGMLQTRDQKIQILEQMAANTQGKPAQVAEIHDEVEEVVSSNGRDRLPG